CECNAFRITCQEPKQSTCLGLTAAPPFSSIAFKRWMKKKETLNFRVSAEFKQRLIEAAKKERRSLTNYLETTLTRLWEQKQHQVTAEGKPERRKQSSN